MYSIIFVERNGGHFSPGLTKSILFWGRYSSKYDFYIFVINDLDLRPNDL